MMEGVGQFVCEIVDVPGAPSQASSRKVKRFAAVARLRAKPSGKSAARRRRLIGQP